MAFSMTDNRPGDLPAWDQKSILLLLLFTVGYLLFYIWIDFYFPSSHATTFWPANAVGLAAYLLTHQRRWPALALIMAVLHLILAFFLYHRSLTFSILATVADTLEPLVCAFLIRRVLRGSVNIFRLRDAACIIAVALGCTAFTSLIGAAAVVFYYGGNNYWPTWWQWYFGNVLGTFLVTPAILGWSSVDWRSFKLTSGRSLLDLGVILVTGLIVHLFFANVPMRAPLDIEYLYLPILLLIWMSVQFHPRVVSSAVLLVAIILVHGAMQGKGPFIQPASTQRETITDIQLYLLLIGLSSMVISSITTERRQALAGYDRALESLNKSKARYRGIVEDQTELIFRSRADGTLTFVNGAYCRYFGKSREELLAQPFLPDVLAADREPITQQFASLSAENPVVTFEHRVRPGEGQPRLNEWTLRAFFDEQGRLIEYQGVGRDITERRRGEEALRAIVAGTSQVVGADFFHNLVRQLTSAIGLHYALIAEVLPDHPERARTLAFWKGEDFAENFEYPLSGTPCQDIMTRNTCIYFQKARSLFPQDEFLGKLSIESYIGTPLRDASGRAIGLMAVMDEQPIAEAALAESILNIFSARAATELERSRAQRALEERLRFDQLLGGISAKFVNLPATQVDEQIEFGIELIAKFIGVDRGTISQLSKDFKQARITHSWAVGGFEPVSRDLDLRLFAYIVPHVMRGEDIKFSRLEELPEEAVGERGFLKHWGIQSHLTIPLRVGGVVLGALSFGDRHPGHLWPEELVEQIRLVGGVFANALARKRAEEELSEESRRKDEFLAMLAHELRNPLAPIRNAIEVLRLAGPNETVLDRQRDLIGRQVTHMSHLLDDLLDMARITKGVIELKKVRMDLRLAVEQTLDAVKALMRDREGDLHYTRPAQPFWVEGDPTRLEQVLSNLLNNAIKYSEAGERIEVWIEVEPPTEGASGAMAGIHIRDAGIGIAPEILPNIFGLFVQADRSLDRTQGGLGIGLTLAQRMMKLHGGTVTATSAGLGRGSEFVIHIPLLFRPDESAGAPFGKPVNQDGRQHVHPGQAHRVLILDDNVDEAQSLGELLEIWGYEVQLAYSGPTALELVRAFQPGVILVDIGLPCMNGYEVARCIRQDLTEPAPLLVAITGYGTPEDSHRAMEAGFDHHLTKPIALEALHNLLENFYSSQQSSGR